jgi:1-acyl-sn-glycerol-3-phosphate acyltransferase
MDWLGGIPIDRSLSHHVVDQMIKEFNEKQNFVLAIAPEGTRHKVNYWKSGFYHVATGAHVPIQIAFIDYGRKTGGAGPLIFPSGDIDRDMIIIRDFYLKINGKHADQTSPAAIFTKA